MHVNARAYVAVDCVSEFPLDVARVAFGPNPMHVDFDSARSFRNVAPQEDVAIVD